MKQVMVVITAIVFLFSCKKDVESATSYLSSEQQFFNNIQKELKDSLPASDYKKVNFTQLFKSKNAQGDYYYVRIGLLNKSMATDFILLQTDNVGNVLSGKLIHVDAGKRNQPKDKKFDGRFTISSLNRQHTTIKEVAGGKWKVGGATASMPETSGSPAGEQELPEVVVVSYTHDVESGMTWYWYDGLYDSGGAAGGNSGGYTYGAAGGGNTTGANTVHDDNTIIIETESTANPAIDVSGYIKCFSTIADANATYQIAIFSDVPVNSEPSFMFDAGTVSLGHSFVQLKKWGGGQSVQQNFGFYPEYGWKAPANVSIDSKVVDNAGHEFNASLTINVNASQFQAALNKIQAIAGYDYNITTWNCTDFALSVFNAASPAPLSIPRIAIPTSTYPMPTTVAYSNTPQGLYEKVQSLQASQNTTYGTADIPGVCGYVGSSHGSCN